jgi:HlyD family secretion protein
MKKFFLFFRRPLGIFLLILMAGIGAYFIFIRKPATPPETVMAEKGNVIQEVSVTGTVKPSQSVDLAFEKSGKIAGVNVGVGDTVFAGQTLVTLVNGDIAAQLDQVRAAVAEQQATLDELKKGTRPEEIQIQQVKVDNARADLADKIEDAYTKSDDAVRNKADQIFSNPRTANPQLNYYLNTDSVLKTDIEWRRVLIESFLNSWESSGTVDAATAKKNLNEIKTFLDKVALVVNNASANSNLTQTTLDTWRADISTGRTNVNTAIVNLAGAESTLANEENELALDKAGSTLEQIASQEAKVEQAAANVKNYEAQLAKTIIWSPINGMVTKQGAKQGEIVGANVVLVSVISQNKFQIETNVPEADIAKVKAGDSAKITLDAYGSNVFFEAKVVKIDPGETMVEGVATYKTTLQFVKEDERVKSGMTANIDILTSQKENVIVVPQRLVISRNGDKFVKVLKDDGTIEEIKVEPGLRGSDGNIEIISGLNEGDKIIISAK